QQGKQGSSYPKVVNIGYLRVPNDEMMAIEQGTIEKNLSKFGIKVNFMVFDSGVEANKALASGSIDFASMGVTNGVVALSKGLDVELIWLHELLGTNEALVTRKQEDLKDLHQLSGKTIATTFASTS
ncbi:MetQ/NlpA family ABC transporter substrate-binding protein, partial [Streptococcus pyogenes]